MTLLLDTHFLLWIVTGSRRLAPHDWLERHRPWGVSPVSLLEVQFLSEVGRVEVQNPGFNDAVASDPRFVLDEAPLLALIRHAAPLSWTRDPFDRMLAGHSLARRLPLATVDRNLRDHHALVLPD